MKNATKHTGGKLHNEYQWNPGFSAETAQSNHMDETKLFSETICITGFKTVYFYINEYDMYRGDKQCRHLKVRSR